jgi:phosphoribosylformimino-5-aminoimidazole carboxamide ribonucleotide (ProFAR) isomerase
VVAGGVTSIAGLQELQEAGVSSVILGEALFTGAIDLAEAMKAVA